LIDPLAIFAEVTALAAMAAVSTPEATTVLALSAKIASGTGEAWTSKLTACASMVVCTFTASAPVAAPAKVVESMLPA